MVYAYEVEPESSQEAFDEWAKERIETIALKNDYWSEMLNDKLNETLEENGE